MGRRGREGPGPISKADATHGNGMWIMRNMFTDQLQYNTTFTKGGQINKLNLTNDNSSFNQQKLCYVTKQLTVQYLSSSLFRAGLYIGILVLDLAKIWFHPSMWILNKVYKLEP